MISFNLKSSLTTAIICFILGCCTAFLLMGSCSNDEQQEKVALPRLLKKQADSIENFYQSKIAALETSNSRLQQELTITKTQLNDVKAKTKQKEATIKKIIAPKGIPAKELLKKVDPSSVAMGDNLSPCDSLVQEVREYMELSEEKKNYYETYIAIQDSIIEVKDSAIAVKTTEHTTLARLFDHSLDEQQKLFTENNQLRKQFKKEKRKGKLLALGTAVLSGLAAHYLTQ